MQNEQGGYPFDADEDGVAGNSGSQERKASDDRQSEHSDEDQKRTWQFRYRFYNYVLPIEDSDAPLTQSGIRPKVVLKVHNWRVDLDLSIGRHKQIDDYLEKSDRKTLDFWRLEDVDASDTIRSRAETLRRLYEMDVGQLSMMLTPIEKERAGIDLNCHDKMELIMAVIDCKKMVA